MRRLYRFVDGKVREVGAAPKKGKKTHYIINDEMPPTLHPATMQYMTSKSKFRETTRALGFEEVGTAYDNGWSPKEDTRPLEKLREGVRESLLRHRK